MSKNTPFQIPAKVSGEIVLAITAKVRIGLTRREYWRAYSPTIVYRTFWAGGWALRNNCTRDVPLQAVFRIVVPAHSRLRLFLLEIHHRISPSAQKLAFALEEEGIRLYLNWCDWMRLLRETYPLLPCSGCTQLRRRRIGIRAIHSKVDFNPYVALR
jgi:hypothetical protein